MFCPSCGNQIPDASKFCPKCGATISAPAAAPAPGPSPASNRASGGSHFSEPTGPVAPGYTGGGLKVGRIVNAVAGVVAAAASCMPLLSVDGWVTGLTSLGSSLYSYLGGGSGNYALADSYSAWSLADMGRILASYDGSKGMDALFMAFTAAWAVGIVLVLVGVATVLAKGKRGTMPLGLLVLAAFGIMVFMVLGNVNWVTVESGTMLLVAVAAIALVVSLAVKPERD